MASPGQGESWHGFTSVSWPKVEQFFPPNAGAGLVQLRVLDVVPTSQVLEHGIQLVHSVKFPSTAAKTYTTIIAL